MKAFQIFDHPFAPSEPYFGFMQHIRDMADSYTLIAPKNFMGPRVEFVPISEVWNALPEVLRKNQAGPRMEFDAMRVYWLAHHFDHVYLDLDVELLAPLDLKPHPQCDGAAVLVGNGDAALGFSCWNAYLRRCPEFCRPATLMFSECPSMRNPDPEDQAKYTHRPAQGQYF